MAIDFSKQGFNKGETPRRTRANPFVTKRTPCVPIRISSLSSIVCPPSSTMPCPFHQQQPDPFGEARRKDGVLVNNFQGTPIPMLLRHEDVRQAAKNWQQFSSD